MTFYDLLDDEEEEEDEEDDAESAASDHETDGNGDDGAGGDDDENHNDGDDDDDCGGGHGMSLDASDVHPPRCVRASCCRRALISTAVCKKSAVNQQSRQVIIQTKHGAAERRPSNRPRAEHDREDHA